MTWGWFLLLFDHVLPTSYVDYVALSTSANWAELHTWPSNLQAAHPWPREATRPRMRFPFPSNDPNITVHIWYLKIYYYIVILHIYICVCEVKFYSDFSSENQEGRPKNPSPCRSMRASCHEQQQISSGHLSWASCRTCLKVDKGNLTFAEDISV
jgi:hypothetical protein